MNFRIVYSDDIRVRRKSQLSQKTRNRRRAIGLKQTFSTYFSFFFFLFNGSEWWSHSSRGKLKIRATRHEGITRLKQTWDDIKSTPFPISRKPIELIVPDSPIDCTFKHRRPIPNFSPQSRNRPVTQRPTWRIYSSSRDGTTYAVHETLEYRPFPEAWDKNFPGEEKVEVAPILRSRKFYGSRILLYAWKTQSSVKFYSLKKWVEDKESYLLFKSINLFFIGILFQR